MYSQSKTINRNKIESIFMIWGIKTIFNTFFVVDVVVVVICESWNKSENSLHVYFYFFLVNGNNMSCMRSEKCCFQWKQVGFKISNSKIKLKGNGIINYADAIEIFGASYKKL